MNLNIDLNTLVTLGGILAGAVAIVVGLRAKIETFRITLQMELKQLNETLDRLVKQVAIHDKEISELKWQMIQATKDLGRGPR